MIPEITNTQIGLMMKAALDFNASLVALAATYYGNMDAKNAKKFRADYKRVFAEYRKQLKYIFPSEDAAE
jgi:hypothetical protein